MQKTVKLLTQILFDNIKLTEMSLFYSPKIIFQAKLLQTCIPKLQSRHKTAWKIVK